VDAVDTNVAVEEPTKPATSPSPPDCEVQEMLHVKPADKSLADDAHPGRVEGRDCFRARAIDVVG